jgi:transcriptional regulator with XRE-family HTH domain
MNVEVSEPLDKMLGVSLRAGLRSQVEKLRKRHGVTQQQIEDALGVTRSYLSHLLAGRNEPSPTLVKMLALFVDVPGAFEHALGRKKHRAGQAKTEQRAEWGAWLVTQPARVLVYHVTDATRAWADLPDRPEQPTTVLTYAARSQLPSPSTPNHIVHECFNLH